MGGNLNHDCHDVKTIAMMHRHPLRHSCEVGNPRSSRATTRFAATEGRSIIISPSWQSWFKDEFPSARE